MPTVPVDAAEFVGAIGEAINDRADSLGASRRATAAGAGAGEDDLAALAVPMLYRSNGATLPGWVLPWVISAAVAAVLAPLVLLVVRLLRVSTVMRYTVSAGPFAPPEDWPWNE